MSHVLLVVRPFGSYVVGDLISGAKKTRDVLTGAHAHDVIRVVAPMPTTEQREET